MGAFRNGGGGGNCSSSAAMEDRRLWKHVHDNVHGNIYLDPLSLKFIDTEQFQRQASRLEATWIFCHIFIFYHYLVCGSQVLYFCTNSSFLTGLSYMVYPGAVHSRFEHSVGVYWLAGNVIEKLKANQGLELDIDHSDIQTVKLAGLLHDVGHGPFSHLFEREFLPRVLNGSHWSHEDMSLKMIDSMVDEHNIDIDPGCLKKVKEMIVASSENALVKTSKEKLFLYDIVANGRNGIDVDKFDYIVRDSRACGLGCNFQFERLLDTMQVIDNEICYRAKEYLTVHKLFYTRADLHRTVYTHAKVKAIELMFVDALLKADSYLLVSSFIHDPSQYWKLDDSILKTIETDDAEELKESRELIRRIRRRDLYQFCNEFTVPKDKLEHFKHVTAQDIICSQKSGGVTLREEDLAVSNVKIDLTRGTSNPLESINFFEDYDSKQKFQISKDQISHLLPACNQDMIVRIYSKKPELVGVVSEAFENFQLKSYGMKAQVHGTPERKKRRTFL
ncbi:hypothetical protein OSB04_018460 [Centaurea solstitialis]|uniref:HD domain-containing protein n=1 Tax=Centaurea solstitialis TaxID=347529 RepID=A0AA38T4W3_9ASTR|nr:hypothetical protein OSB04_018460 [Centaurea solstitialis]